jgi:hypothetical protein
VNRSNIRPIRVLVLSSLMLVAVGATHSAAQTVSSVVRAGAAIAEDGDNSKPQIAFNVKRQEYLVVWTQGQYPAEQMVRALRLGPDGAPRGTPVTIVTTGGSPAAWPQVAYHVGTDRYLVIWQAAPGPYEIRGRFLTSAGQLDTDIGEFAITSQSVPVGTPALAAANFSTAGDTAFLVSWVHNGTQLQYTRVRLDGTRTPADILWIDGRSGNTQTPGIGFDPRRNKFVLGWLIVEQAFEYRIVAASISTSGVEADFTTLESSGGSPWRPIRMQFDPASDMWVAVYSAAGSVNVRYLAGETLAPTPRVALLVDRSTYYDIAVEPGSFLLTYTYRHPDINDFDSDLYLARVRYTPRAPLGPVQVTHLGEVFSDVANYQAQGEKEDSEVSLSPLSQYGFAVAVWVHEDAPNLADSEVYAAQVSSSTARFIHSAGNLGGGPASDLAIFRPSTGLWYVRHDDGSVAVANWGVAGDIPVLFDPDGNGTANLSVWRPSNGVWYSYDPATGATSGVPWGVAGDIPVPGNYVGGAGDDIAVWRPSTGEWWVRDSATGAISRLLWGRIGDVPVPADYDGDGRVEPAVWRPSEGLWYISQLNGTGQRTVRLGSLGDIPMVGNFFGDDAADFVVYEPYSGRWVRRDGTTGATESEYWGLPGDVPVSLDLDHDGRLDLGIWRPSSGRWFILDDDLTSAVTALWGVPGDVVATGK